MRILITGGAGFIGSTVALHLRAAFPDWTLTAFDNLRRRGSELNVGRLANHGIQFVHGDVRLPADLAALPSHDLVIECSAEPSVSAGYSNDSAYLIDTNLSGAVHCLEAARRWNAGMIFLSTSRVYPLAALSRLSLREEPTRFTLQAKQEFPGVSASGISESFPLDGARTLYGASKLCAELLVQEYAEAYGMRAIINRCGLIAGPWQWARSDQGVVAHWAAKHFFGGSLNYIGHGGGGRQVRDVLHAQDLAALIEIEITHLETLAGRTFNVGGGSANSVSLCELTGLCVERGRRRLEIGHEPDARRGDIPYYVTDHAHVTEATGWSPTRTIGQTLDDIFSWFEAHEDMIAPYFNA